MSVYFEKARELGTMILQSEESKNLTDAGAEFDANPDARNKLNEYKAYHREVQIAYQNKTMTEEEVAKASQKLSQMAAELKKDPIVAALIYAEDEFNTFVAQVMNILKQTITGAPLNDCGEGGCASCSGCGHQNAE